ncbi:MAG: hypothetical protein F6K26_17105 [Moorea sp. SIO2I5]|nr:hypothetical protein [Moorena sp. SIO2I5]
MPTLQERLAVGHATLRKLRPLATLCERFRAYAIAFNPTYKIGLRTQ